MREEAGCFTVSIGQRAESRQEGAWNRGDLPIKELCGFPSGWQILGTNSEWGGIKHKLVITQAPWSGGKAAALKPHKTLNRLFPPPMLSKKPRCYCHSHYINKQCQATGTGFSNCPPKGCPGLGLPLQPFWVSRAGDKHAEEG